MGYDGNLYSVDHWWIDDRRWIPGMLRSPARKPVLACHVLHGVADPVRWRNRSSSVVVPNPAEFRKLVEEKLSDLIRNKYDDDQVIRESFDLLQQKYKCCGVDGYHSWSKTENNAKKLAAGVNYEVPKSCCSDPGSNLCETTRNLGVGGLVVSSLSGTIYTEGCAPKVEKWLRDSDNTTYLIGIGIGILVMELLGMIFSLVLCCRSQGCAIQSLKKNER